MANNTCVDSLHPSTGDVVVQDIIVNDSVLISYDDLRLANIKLIELDYEKKINNNLRSIIVNDSIIIQDYKRLNIQLNKDCKKYIRQRNIAIRSGIAAFVITTLLLLLK